MNQTRLTFPDWTGSILNVSATLQDYLGTPNDLPKIELLKTRLQNDYKNVVYIIVDGMGLGVLEKHLPAKSFLRTHVAKTITSVFPSTTTCATTTILSATPPARHGWFAWAMNFGDRTIELYRDRDYYTGEPLDEKGFADKRLPYDYFFEHPSKPIDTYSCLPSKIVNFKRWAKMKDAVTFDNDKTKTCFKQLDRLCKRDRKKFVYTYHCQLDGVMHRHGATSNQARKVLLQLDKGLKWLAKRNPDTLLVVTADHGHIDVRGFVDIYRDTDLMSCLSQKPSLDPRAGAFFVKPTMRDDFKKAFAKYEHDFALFETNDLIKRGVFGEFDCDKHKEFLGDFIAVGTDTHKILVFADEKRYTDKDKKLLYKGHHTGLSKEEMIVPLIVIGNEKGSTSCKNA